jgi:hypothetical protein
MRLAQDEVKVNVIGTDRIGEFTTVDPGGYVLIHEQDLGKLIETIKELRK